MTIDSAIFLTYNATGGNNVKKTFPNHLTLPMPFTLRSL